MTANNVILLSGGIDSAVCLRIAKERSDYNNPLFFKYGQQSEEYELRAAKQQILEVGETIQLIDYTPVFNNFKVGTMEDREYDSFQPMDGNHSVGYVPQRNLMMLSAASAWAESKLPVGHNINLYFGAQAGDDEAYPDCRQEFVMDALKALNRGTDEHQITIEAPLLGKSKKEVIELGEEYGVDWSNTVSCYNPPDFYTGCGECPACMERRIAFEEAGIMDPINYDY